MTAIQMARRSFLEQKRANTKHAAQVTAGATDFSITARVSEKQRGGLGHY